MQTRKTAPMLRRHSRSSPTTSGWRRKSNMTLIDTRRNAKTTPADSVIVVEASSVVQSFHATQAKNTVGLILHPKATRSRSAHRDEMLSPHFLQTTKERTIEVSLLTTAYTTAQRRYQYTIYTRDYACERAEKSGNSRGIPDRHFRVRDGGREPEVSMHAGSTWDIT
ncbi:hypothetical protein BD310DRAFT_306035 [Dichomitus squalens]|uniref:Uncharacterized protein n=1 Tax=Dichomitus squalens TaxID=114155 RepID=A0A4Q9QBU5_9APHY|nr:hypothetical protein BD310DRAFT_306035 [Dichomitus squalens]